MKPGRIYHIYNHANGEENLFREQDNYDYFLDQYLTYIQPIARTFAYCLLPNHFHFLLQIKDLDFFFDLFTHSPKSNTVKLPRLKNVTEPHISKQVVKQFSNFFNCYSRSYNNFFDRKGKLFLTPFKRKLVSTNRQFLNTWKYIHSNPVHHGFCKNPFDWTYSSVHDYRLKDPNWIATDIARKKTGPLNLHDSDIFSPDWRGFVRFEY